MKYELKQLDAHTKVLVEVPEPEAPAPEPANRGPKPKVSENDGQHPKKPV